MSAGRDPRVLVVGAGFGGIAAAVELRRHGFADVRILDAADSLGGTWHQNTYPGAACDVPSPFYSYSFAQREGWTRLCAPQTEILAYLREVAREQGVEASIETGCRVADCTWADAEQQWTVRCEDGREFTGDAVVLATGQLHQPLFARIPGADTFAGHVFHSAEWDHDYDLSGKRVAVVGTGASAVQFVPEIAAEVAHLTVYQRTGNWFMPRVNHPYGGLRRRVLQHVPGVHALRRRYWFWFCESLTQMIRHPRTLGRIGALRSALFMRRQLPDAELRRKVWPDYRFGCKRVLFSSHFLPALGRPNVDLVTDAIAGFAPEGVVTADGTVREADCVIYATGFKTTEFMFPMEVTGVEGRSLRESWADGAHAHLGLVVPGFPSLFIMYGPNTNTSGGSIITYLEAQAGYVRRALELVRDRGAAAIEIRPEVEAASDAALQARFSGTAWTQCDSWYRDGSGRIVTNWPDAMVTYLRKAAEVDAGDFVLHPERIPAQVLTGD